MSKKTKIALVLIACIVCFGLAYIFTYVPIPYKAVPSLTSGELLKSFSIMLEDKIAEGKALIQVEKINGS